MLLMAAWLALPVEPGSTPPERPAAMVIPAKIAAAAQNAGCMPAALAGHWTFDVVAGRAVRWNPKPPAGVERCIAMVLGDFPRDMTHVTLVYPPRAH